MDTSPARSNHAVSSAGVNALSVVAVDTRRVSPGASFVIPKVICHSKVPSSAGRCTSFKTNTTDDSSLLPSVKFRFQGCQVTLLYGSSILVIIQHGE